MTSRISRRDFSRAALATAAAGSIAAPNAAGRVLGANDRVTVGCIGVGNRGVQVLNAFCAHRDAQIVALSDVYEPYLQGKYDQIDPRFKDLGKRVPTRQPDFGGPVERVKDFRRLLDRKDIDAVIVATPDHWHAIQVSMACAAGKDVYAEKPLSATVKEGRRMVEAARKHDRVVQVGLQRRSSVLYAKLADLVRSGGLGKIGLKAGEIELRGTLGTAYAGIDRFEVVPDRGGAFQDPTPRRKPQVETAKVSNEDLDRAHARNFLDCVKSRIRPNADIEDGH